MKRIGRMRHRVTIQQLSPNSPQQDAGGTPDETWGTYITGWAEITPLKGRELESARQTNPEVTGQARMRWRSGVDSRMRILFGSRTLEILAVINVEERSREMQLLYKEGPSVG